MRPSLLVNAVLKDDIASGYACAVELALDQSEAIEGQIGKRGGVVTVNDTLAERSMSVVIWSSGCRE